MQLGGGAPLGPRPRTAPDALIRGAAALGHRPAVSLLLAAGRQEQSGASLAQWAAKGAHLLELDLLLEPGDEVRLAAPWSWTTAAVALAAWWAGGVVRLDAPGQADDAGIAVVGPGTDPGDAEEVFVLGDGIDGAPHAPDQSGPEPWTRAAQPFPDQPPVPRAAHDAPAVVHGARTIDHRDVLDLAGSHGEVGTLGLHVDATAPADIDAPTALALLALRPLLSGRPTVVLRGADRSAAEGDRVTQWVRTT